MNDFCIFEQSHMMEASPQPQSPWILFFDGAIRDNKKFNTLAGIGAVLKNNRGYTMVELKKLVDPGVSSEVAKYKALIAGLKKALSLGVEFLLVKGNSRLIHNQVVGHCSVQDERLVDYQRKVITLSKDFRALFLERISREDNLRADQLANDAIDEELHVVDSLSEFIDQERRSQEKRASQQRAVHSHIRHHNHSSAHPTHPIHASRPLPLLLPAPHLKVKPVASVSPHVVKRQAGAATKSEDARRFRLFNTDEEHYNEQPQVRNHVQAAAKTVGCSPSSSSTCRRPEISASLLQLWEDVKLEESEEYSGSSGEGNLTQALVTTCNSQQDGGEGNSILTGDGSYLDMENENKFARAEYGSSSRGECESEDGLCEEDYSRLLKTLLKGFIKRSRS